MYTEENPKSVTMAVGEYGHHGDIVIECIASLPDDFATLPDAGNILAPGSQPGHEHVVFGDHFSMRRADDVLYIKTDDTITLKHQTHRPITLLGAGVYIGYPMLEKDHINDVIRAVED